MRNETQIWVTGCCANNRGGGARLELLATALLWPIGVLRAGGGDRPVRGSPGWAASAYKGRPASKVRELRQVALRAAAAGLPLLIDGALLNARGRNPEPH